LNLDELPVGAHEVDHVPVHPHLELIARGGQEPLQLAVQRAFAQLADHPENLSVKKSLDLLPSSVHTAAHGFRNRFWRWRRESLSASSRGAPAYPSAPCPGPSTATPTCVPRRASASCASRPSWTTRRPPRPAAWSPSART